MSEQTPNTSTEPKPKQGNSGKQRGRVRRWFTYFFIFLIVLLGYSAYRNDQVANWIGQKFTRAPIPVVNDFMEAQKSYNASVHERFETLEKRQQQMQDNFADLLARQQLLRKDWLLAEAEYLVKIASHRLALEHDVETAVVALHAADDRLRDTRDPVVLKVRKLIARDIRTLEQLPKQDTAGISLAISALAQQVDKLPLRTPDPKTMQQREATPPTPINGDGWKAMAQNVWDDIKGLVVIRNHEQPIEALLAPDQRFFLSENLRLQLEQARLALLNNEPVIYRERLNTAVNWIKHYFDNKAVETITALTTLKQLATVKFLVELPDISSTYDALMRYRLRGEVPEVEAPAKPQPVVPGKGGAVL